MPFHVIAGAEFVYPAEAQKEQGTSSRPRGSLENRFQGAWGADADSAVPQPQSPRPGPAAGVSPKGEALVAQQMLGSLGTSRNMGGSRTKADLGDELLKPSEALGADDPALPPILGLRGSGVAVPQGSAVPHASLSMTQQGSQATSLTGQQTANEQDQGEADALGSGAGLTKQASKDVNLAKPREQLPNVNVNLAAEEGGEASRGSARPGRSIPPTPKSAPGIQPTSVETPSKHQCRILVYLRFDQQPL